MATHIRNHDSGYSLERDRHYVTGQTCMFCGGVRETPKHRKYLYKYSVSSPMGRIEYINGIFCSIQCMRAYHALPAY